MSKSKTIIALLVANLLAVLYVGFNINAALRDNSNRTDSEVRMLQHQVQTLESQILNGISSALTAQADKVERFDYSVIAADLSQKKAKIGLQVVLKEVSSTADLSASLRREGQTDPLNVVLEHQGGMQYGAELELSPSHDYELTVWEQSDAGQRQLTAEARRLPLFSDIYTERVAEASLGTSRTDQQLNADLSFSLKDMGIQGAGIKEVWLRMHKDGEVYDEIDMTWQAKPIAAEFYGELEDQYKIARASGQIGDSVTIEQYASNSGQASAPHVQVESESYSYARYELNYLIQYDKDYPELKLDRSETDRLSFEWVLRFEDGYERLY